MTDRAVGKEEMLGYMAVIHSWVPIDRKNHRQYEAIRALIDQSGPERVSADSGATGQVEEALARLDAVCCYAGEHREADQAAVAVLRSALAKRVVSRERIKRFVDYLWEGGYQREFYQATEELLREAGISVEDSK